MRGVKIKSPEDLGSIYRHPCILSLRVATLKEGATLGTNKTPCKGHPFTKETHCMGIITISLGDGVGNLVWEGCNIVTVWSPSIIPKCSHALYDTIVGSSYDRWLRFCMLFHLYWAMAVPKLPTEGSLSYPKISSACVSALICLLIALSLINLSIIKHETEILWC